VFSAVGGLIPAAVTSYSVRIAPAEGSVTAVLGLTQQIFNVGNFVGPMLFALLATTTGGWGTTWWLSCGLSTAGMALLVFLGRPGGASVGSVRRSQSGFPPNGKLECKADHTSLESRKRRQNRQRLPFNDWANRV
jgi:MFS family permease